MTDALRSADETLPLHRSAGQSNNSTVVFLVDVADSIQRSKDKTLHLQVVEIHKRRREPYPQKVSILERQSFMFTDNGVILSPYKVLKQSLLLTAPKNSMVIKLSDNMAKATGGYSFSGDKVDVAPYTS